MNLDLRIRWIIFWHFKLPGMIWKLRGLSRCEKHGFHAQCLICGQCRECSPKTSKEKNK